MDARIAKSIIDGADDLPLVRLSEIAQEIRPYRVYASYGVLYRMAREGDFQTLRDRRGRLWVVGSADELAARVMERFSYCNGRWSPRTDRRRLHDRIQTTE